MGTLINTAAVIAGGTLGLLLGHRLPKRVQETVMHGLGLVTLVIGAQLALETKNILIVLGSLLLGGILGEWWEIEERLENLGRRLEKWLAKKGATSDEGKIPLSRGFVMASLLFCVGPMTILGSMQDGLTGDFTLLATKSLLDGFASLALASTLGVGVPLAALTVFTYQGTLTLLAAYLGGFLTDPMIGEISAAGGVLIIGLGLVLLEIKRLRVANYLPALLIAPLVVAILTMMGVSF
jgi:hypothetical protein